MHPQATIQKTYDPKSKITSYIFNDDTRGFFDKQSVSYQTMSKHGEEEVEKVYIGKLERRFYR